MSDIKDFVEQRITESFVSWQDNSPRSRLARDGYLGASDIGFCRQKAVLVTRETVPTDNPSKWAAFIGTAVGKEIELALHASNPSWYVGSIANLEVNAKFPSGVTMGGHPDVVAPDINAVLDIKTVDGLEWVRRQGSSLSHKYQRHIYALGCIQAGILDKDKPVYVGNIYFDRSGKDNNPVVEVEEIDWTLTDQIDSWIQDVVYAVKNFEDSSRDVPAAVCERICEFFTVCRGGLDSHDGGDQIDDPELVSAVAMYVEAREIAKKADQMKSEAQAKLLGVNGATDEYQVRWVDVAPTTVESFEKRGYTRMDIRKLRK